MKLGHSNNDEDLRQIENLHQRDVEASKNRDYETLRSLLTRDAVIMPPGAPWIRGAKQLENSYQRMEEAMKEIEVLDYEIEFEEIKILGDYAFEWGTIRGASRSKDKKAEKSSYKVMRILKKTNKGEWKVHRAIWNENPSE